LHRDRLSLGIDISGPAHRRGYRTAAGAAPLRENLAAAVLLRAGWPALALEGGCGPRAAASMPSARGIRKIKPLPDRIQPSRAADARCPVRCPAPDLTESAASSQ
jgi:hypothetical protein